MSFKALEMKWQGSKCFQSNNKKIKHHLKGVLKGSLAFMQHFKFINW
jgi:hypothetical protein